MRGCLQTLQRTSEHNDPLLPPFLNSILQTLNSVLDGEQNSDISGIKARNTDLYNLPTFTIMQGNCQVGGMSGAAPIQAVTMSQKGLNCLPLRKQKIYSQEETVQYP